MNEQLTFIGPYRLLATRSPLAAPCLFHGVPGVSAVDEDCSVSTRRSSAESLEPRRNYSHFCTHSSTPQFTADSCSVPNTGPVLLLLVFRGLLDRSGVSFTIALSAIVRVWLEDLATLEIAIFRNLEPPAILQPGVCKHDPDHPVASAGQIEQGLSLHLVLMHLSTLQLTVFILISLSAAHAPLVHL
ncbi:hypothetical protein BJX70DRAFT_292859 [Aspergillus crustosus]